MPQFLTSAACNGSRPRRVKPIADQISRPAIIARLMRERHVPRFLVAPAGFGKTAIALEYAETVFRFQKVFWIDAASPCFLRDLDSGVLAQSLIAAESTPFLVVIEDIPLFDKDRLERFSADMDLLLDQGCELLVTCSPACDSFDCRCDRIVLTSADLLLTDNELDELRTPAERERLCAHEIPSSRRVAALRWGRMSTGERLQLMLGKDLKEDIPVSVLTEFFVMLCLEWGSLQEVSALTPVTPDDFAFIEKYYSYMGICEAEGIYATASFETRELHAVFGPYMSQIAEHTGHDRTTLITMISDQLLAKGKAKRACELLVTFASKAARASWLSAREKALMSTGCLVPALELFDSLGTDALRLQPTLIHFQALSLFLLGDHSQAFSCARKAAKATSLSFLERLEMHLVALRSCEEDQREKCYKAACDYVRDACSGRQEGPFGVGFSKEVLDAVVLLSSPLDCDISAKVHVLASLLMQGVPASMILRLVVAMLSDIKSQYEACIEVSLPTDKRASISWIGTVLQERLLPQDLNDVTFGEASAVLLFNQISSRILDQDVPWGKDCSDSAVAVIEQLYSQRAQWMRKGSRRNVQKRSQLEQQHHDIVPTRDLAYTYTRVPEKLTVKLFGGLEVYRGETRVDPLLLRRKNVRILLALLVLNRGREFSRDFLVSQMWPGVELASGRRSFYTTWAFLKQALGPTKQTCPYLIRQQLGVRIDGTLLDSDVFELEKICHHLLFESADYTGWASIHERVTTVFSEDLLPGVEACPIIDGWRVEYRNRLIDALTSASNRLRSAGKVQDALWFSQVAYQRAPIREDVCVTLMRAQIEAGQRSAAISTYHALRRGLADELGIDPSIETMNLYNRIIEAEEHLY